MSKRQIVSLKRDELELYRRENKELRDNLLRLAADFDNYRKRLSKEKEEHIKLAAESVVRDILPVRDNFVRAIASAHNHKDFDAFKQGITMIENQLEDVLKDSGVSEIKAQGVMFDPRYHEIMMEEESDTAAEGVVLEVLQKGYTMSGRVIRPAMVKVSKKKEKKED